MHYTESMNLAVHFWRPLKTLKIRGQFVERFLYVSAAEHVYTRTIYGRNTKKDKAAIYFYVVGTFQVRYPLRHPPERKDKQDVARNWSSRIFDRTAARLSRNERNSLIARLPTALATATRNEPSKKRMGRVWSSKWYPRVPERRQSGALPKTDTLHNHRGRTGPDKRVIGKQSAG